ncbi:hypothetical protein HYY69_03460 [Candidatus Woesearchaeota archaeon]|nr:hypothetical protein [Candidatus Woesearchaeota archaeon]
MNEEDSLLDDNHHEKHATHLGLIFGWVVGILFALAGYKFLEASIIVAIILWALALLLIPLTRDIIQDNLKLKLSAGHTFAFIIIGFVIAGYMYNSQGLENPLVKIIDEAQAILPFSDASNVEQQASDKQPKDVAGAATTGQTSISQQSSLPSAEPQQPLSSPSSVVTVPNSYKYKLEKSGVTLYIEDIVFEQRGASFGDITKVKYTVVNNVGKAITPALKMLVYEKNQDPSVWANKVLDTIASSVANGNSFSELVLTKLTIPTAANEKIIKFMLYDKTTNFTYLTLSDKIQFMPPAPIGNSS